MNLAELGWNTDFERHFEPWRSEGMTPARVAREEKNAFLVLTEQGELGAEISGKLRHEAQGRGDLPAVGDWVAIRARPEEGKATIHAVLPRKSRFARKVPGGRTQEQVIAANVDTVFLVSGLDGDFSLHRIERYLTLAWESGAQPVIVLNKADVCADLPGQLAEVEARAMGTPVHTVSALQHLGVDALRTYLRAGETIAFLGSSGVGKSSLINALLGEQRLKTGAVRAGDDTGRHITTHRELLLLPQGGIVIDTPGLRELQLWADEKSVGLVFEDIESLAAQCRFKDCSHQNEPSCAVQAAIAGGTLATDRLQSYRALQGELRDLSAKQDVKERLAQKAQAKRLSRTIKDYFKRQEPGEKGRP